MNPVPAFRFSDGRSAAARSARADPGLDALHIVDETGARLALWPYDGLYLAEDVYRNQPVRLMHRDAGAACLTLPDSAALQALRKRSPGLSRAIGRSRRWTDQGIVWMAVFLVVLAPGLVWGLPRLAGAVAPLVPGSWGRAVGDRLVASVERDYPACNRASDLEGRRALERLVARLLRASPGGADPAPFAVVVVDSPIPNALAAPGARIIVFRGILGLTRAPEELAGVLAHETGHALAWHPERGMLRALGWKWLLGGWLGTDSWGAGSLRTLLLLAYTREDERTADRTGMALLEREGLRNDGLAALLERLAGDPKLSARGVPGFLASHPLPEERARELRALVNPRIAGAPWTKREWQAIQGLCGKR